MFDCAIIGTSPICLLEALFRHQAGEKIVLLDDAPQLGGVWAVSPIFSNDPIEIYCHILSYDRGGYEVLDGLFPSAFAPLPFEPEILVYRPGEIGPDQQAILRGRLPFTSERYRHLQDNEALIRSGQGFSGLQHRLRETFNARIKGQRHVYPIGGFAEILKRLETAIAKTDITVQLGTRVALVSGYTDRTDVTLTVQNDRGTNTISARQIVVTTRTGLEKIALDGEEIELIATQKVTSFRHLVAEIATPQASTYSYIDLRGHPSIRRAQNITLTNNLRGKRQNWDVETHIIQMNIGPDEPQVDSANLLDAMRAVKAIHPKSELIQSTYTDKSRVNIETGAIQTLKKRMADRIQLLNTNNLSRAVAAHSDRWRKLSPSLKL